MGYDDSAPTYILTGMNFDSIADLWLCFLVILSLVGNVGEGAGGVAEDSFGFPVDWRD